MTAGVKFCIIHPHCIEEEQCDPTLSPYKQAIAKRAWQVIQELRQSSHDVFVLECGEPQTVAHHYKKGDLVILCGAFRLGCLLLAEQALKRKGCHVLYHRYATISLFLGTEDADWERLGSAGMYDPTSINRALQWLGEAI